MDATVDVDAVLDRERSTRGRDEVVEVAVVFLFVAGLTVSTNLASRAFRAVAARLVSGCDWEVPTVLASGFLSTPDALSLFPSFDTSFPLAPSFDFALVTSPRADLLAVPLVPFVTVVLEAALFITGMDEAAGLVEVFAVVARLEASASALAWVVAVVAVVTADRVRVIGGAFSSARRVRRV